MKFLEKNKQNEKNEVGEQAFFLLACNDQAKEKKGMWMAKVTKADFSWCVIDIKRRKHKEDNEQEELKSGSEQKESRTQRSKGNHGFSPKEVLDAWVSQNRFMKNKFIKKAFQRGKQQGIRQR